MSESQEVIDRNPSLGRRLLAKVSKGPECWIWNGSTGKNGYGRIGAGRGRSPLLAHRASWMVHVGPIPHGLLVCHTCDVRNCVNPEHLFLGTAKDNTMDMISKGRMSVGESRPNAVLTDETARELRAYSGPMTQSQLGELYGISQSHVSSVINGKRWVHGG